MDVIWKLDQQGKELCFCHPVCESLWRCWALCVGPNTGKTTFQPLPLLFKANLPLLQRELLHCASNRQADPIPVPGSTRTPSAQHKMLSLLTLLSCSGSAWKWKKAQSRELSREELLSLIFWNIWLSPFLWKKKNWMTAIYIEGMDSKFLRQFACAYQAAECFFNSSSWFCTTISKFCSQVLWVHCITNQKI